MSEYNFICFTTLCLKYAYYNKKSHYKLQTSVSSLRLVKQNARYLSYGHACPVGAPATLHELHGHPFLYYGGLPVYAFPGWISFHDYHDGKNPSGWDPYRSGKENVICFLDGTGENTRIIFSNFLSTNIVVNMQLNGVCCLAVGDAIQFNSIQNNWLRHAEGYGIWGSVLLPDAVM